MGIIGDVVNDPVIIPAGATVLGIHILLFLLFKYVLPDGPWKKLPSFTAHQVVAFGMMTFHTFLGFKHFGETELLNINEGGMFLARIAMGSMMLWDIPVGFVSDGMGDPIMHLHHIGFFFVSAITLGYLSDGIPLGSAYAPFFFGVVEVSSIPLAIVDVFHPKQKAWHEYLSTSKTLETINDNSRIAFALCYVATRVLYFPVLIFRNVVPDCWTLAHESPELATPLYVLLVLSILFTFLQLYWGSLIIRQIIKAVSGGDSETKKKKE